MEYAYFNPPPPQHYPFMGMQTSAGFPHAGLDPETLHSIEPLDAGLLPQNGSYDAFSFAHGVPISQGSPIPNTPNPVGSVDSGFGGDLEDGRTIPTTRSSSEEKEGLTPAQSRRKAQNRAAQRAFRERKERHVRDLEAKLSLLESSAHSLQSDNERLKLALQRARTENEILRATSARSPSNSRPVSATYSSSGDHNSDYDEEEESYNVQSLSDGTVLTNGDLNHHLPKKSSKARDIPASQLWDTIHTHHLVKQGVVDVADVCERLKGAAKCGGSGPVYDERLIWAAIESSRKSGGDELI
ncbi:unnamed protein product [Periconia digitata]|uniref:BZIP domain-containing protein n=1 Tax=Periconia digitata TaxID=1303443 RepID=A0A9W4XLB3_9PLEO|nr:unnamed protein product [Periconia digitata]